MPQGRPKNVRAGGSGEKLYMALKLAGVAWGAKLGPGHIAANKHWAACGLPKSSNTVNEDIRSGIPANRLDNYAAFFQVSPTLFVDEGISPSASAFSCEILKNKHHSRSCAAFAFPAHDAAALERLAEQNQDKYLYELHRTVVGVYSLYCQDGISETLWKGAAAIGGQFEGGLQVSGRLVVDGVPLGFGGILFRWHNCLHVQYHSTDYQILGYMMTPDPLQSFALRRRTPFYMTLYGLSGNPGLSMEPRRLVVCAVRQAEADAQDGEQAYAALCQAVARDPVLAPNEAHYPMVMRALANA